jgi:hypothetical protein
MQSNPQLCSRFPYRANAVLIRLPRIYEATLIDISVHGALVRLENDVEIGIGDQTRLRVLTERGNQAFEVDAVVVHRSEQGIALEINAIDHHALSTLHRLIEMNLGTVDLATRTLPVLLRENFTTSPAQAGNRARSGYGSQPATAS